MHLLLTSHCYIIVSNIFAIFIGHVYLCTSEVVDEPCAFDKLAVDDFFKGDMPNSIPEDTSDNLEYYEVISWCCVAVPRTEKGNCANQR